MVPIFLEINLEYFEFSIIIFFKCWFVIFQSWFLYSKFQNNQLVGLIFFSNNFNDVSATCSHNLNNSWFTDVMTNLFLLNLLTFITPFAATLFVILAFKIRQLIKPKTVLPLFLGFLPPFSLSFINSFFNLVSTCLELLIGNSCVFHNLF